MSCLYYRTISTIARKLVSLCICIQLPDMNQLFTYCMYVAREYSEFMNPSTVSTTRVISTSGTSVASTSASTSSTPEVIGSGFDDEDLMDEEDMTAGSSSQTASTSIPVNRPTNTGTATPERPSRTSAKAVSSMHIIVIITGVILFTMF